MSMTIKELAQKLNMGQSGVQNKITRMNLRDKHVKKVGRKSYVDDAGVKILLGSGNHRNDTGDTNETSRDSTSDKRVTLRMTRELLKQEREHNVQLQKQLERMDSSNSHLGKLLDQQQQLQIATQHENVQLKGQIKHLKTIPGHVEQSKDKDKEPAKEPKLSFWQRLFGKRK